MSCERIREELDAYYRDRKRAKPDLTTIPYFSLKTLGGRGMPLLKTKAAETKELLQYVVQALGQHGGGVGGPRDAGGGWACSA